ncbi:MAG: sigma factor-like helix-turn-helix DNA-binding protein, partial [Candidatus Binatia bacterium]
LEVRDAARHLIGLLPPQERAALVLKDIFDFRLEEIATILQTTTGAVKAALHRGRGKLAEPAPLRCATPASEALLDQFVAAFNARDLARVAALLRSDAVGEVVGIGASHGRDAIRDSSLYYSLFLEKGEPRAERHTYLGEPILVVWYDIDPPRPPLVRDVLRFEALEGAIARLRFFAFCPETMAEVVGGLGLPFKDCGYGVWAPQFLELQKQDEFQQWITQR